MLVINNSARLITINFDGEKYKLLPAGPSVEMPDEAAEDCKFLQILADQGDVKVLEAPKKGSAKEEDDPLAELREEAIALGVEKVTKNWGEAKLKAAIEEAKENQSQGE